MPGRRETFQDIANWELGCEWRQGWLHYPVFSEADRQHLADALGLDPLSTHFRTSSVRVHLHPLDSNIDQPIGEFVSWVDEAAEEALATLHRFAAIFFAIDQTASIAQIRKHLRVIACHPERYTSRIDHLDPNTLEYLEPFLPNRELSLGRTGIIAPAVLKQAAERALVALPRPPRGRRRSEAWKRLAEDLADIYSRYATKPTRRVHERGRESGPFRDFVEIVVSKIPLAHRMTTKGHIKRVDYLVRVGIQSLRPPCPRKHRSDTHITP